MGQLLVNTGCQLLEYNKNITLGALNTVWLATESSTQYVIHITRIAVTQLYGIENNSGGTDKQFQIDSLRKTELIHYCFEIHAFFILNNNKCAKKVTFL